MDAEALKALRARRGLTQEELAALLNQSLGRRYDKAKVSRWEGGKEPLPDAVASFLRTGGRTRVIAVALQKGGSAKTTLALNLSAALRRLGRRVLLVDADPQASATVGLGLDAYAIEQAHRNLNHVLMGEAPLADCVVEAHGVGVVPSGPSLARFEVVAPSMVASEKRLKAALAEVASGYDYIVVDTPPHLGVLTKSALTAATDVIIPVCPAPLDVFGVPMLLETVAEVRRYENPDIRVIGIVPSRYDARNAVERQILKELQEQFAGKVPVLAPVRRSTGFDQALYNGVVAIDALPPDHPVHAYTDIARGIIGHEA